MKTLLFSLAILGCLSSCVKDARINTEDIKKGFEAFAKIDPVGIRTLLDDNKRLRENYETVIGKYTAITKGYPLDNSSGVIILNNRSVRIRVSEYNGHFKVTGWIDKRSNFFWDNKEFKNIQNSLPVPFHAVFEDWKKYNPHTNIIFDPNHRDLFIANLQQHTDHEFREYLNQAQKLTGPQTTFSDLNPLFHKSGKHNVYLEITPLDADKNNNWSMTCEIASVGSTDMREERPIQFTVSNTLNKGNKIDQTIKKKIRLKVRTRRDQ